MLCEKCQSNTAKVHFRRTRDDSGQPLSTPVEHHFCEDCARDFIQADPVLKQAKWSKPTLHLKIEGTQVGEPPPEAPGKKDSQQP